MKKIARAFLRNNDWDFLFVKHTWKEDWVLAWWHVEEKENVYKAIKREIKEELNLKIKIIWNKIDLKQENIKEKSLPLSVYEIKIKDKKRLEYIFLAKIDDISKIKIQEKEISEYKFFSKNEVMVLENTFAHYKEILKNIN